MELAIESYKAKSSPTVAEAPVTVAASNIASVGLFKLVASNLSTTREAKDSEIDSKYSRSTDAKDWRKTSRMTSSLLFFETCVKVDSLVKHSCSKKFAIKMLSDRFL